jgi:hypothetical protein
MNDSELNRRRDARAAAVKSGKLLYGFFSPTVIDCLVLEVSDIGARVETAEMTRVPEKLSLRLSDGDKRLARRSWARGNQIGLEFTAARRKLRPTL